MKRNLITAAILLFAIVSRGQQPDHPAGSFGQPPSMEERIKRTNDVIQKEVQPNSTQQAAIEKAWKSFFTAMDQLRKDNPPPPPPPPDPKVKEAMDKLVKERDETVKKVLSDAQYQKYQEVAKQLQPPKPGEQRTGQKPPPPPQQQ